MTFLDALKISEGCFEVVETGAPGCEKSYTDDTTVTLRVS